MFVLRLLIHWILSAVALWLVTIIVPGLHVDNASAALIAALLIGLVNSTLGLVLKILTFPLTLVTLGIFWIVINAVMIEIAASFMTGFQVSSFGAAFVGAIVLSIINAVFRMLEKAE